MIIIFSIEEKSAISVARKYENYSQRKMAQFQLQWYLQLLSVSFWVSFQVTCLAPAWLRMVSYVPFHLEKVFYICKISLKISFYSRLCLKLLETSKSMKNNTDDDLNFFPPVNCMYFTTRDKYWNNVYKVGMNHEGILFEHYILYFFHINK